MRDENVYPRFEKGVKKNNLIVFDKSLACGIPFEIPTRKKIR